MTIPLLGFTQRDWSEVKVNSTKIAPGIYRLYIGDGVAMIAFYGGNPFRYLKMPGG